MIITVTLFRKFQLKKYNYSKISHISSVSEPKANFLRKSEELNTMVEYVFERNIFLGTEVINPPFGYGIQCIVYT